MTEIVKGWPPNIDAIRKVLPVTRRNIFAYGGVIYAPGGKDLSPALIAHEKVHFRQQAAHPGGVEGWWAQFLTDVEFRLDQELEAHRVEYQTAISLDSSRHNRRKSLKLIAGRLAKPMYGGIISAAEAKRRIAA